MKKKILTVALVLSSVCAMAQQRKIVTRTEVFSVARMKRIVSGVTGILV